MTHLALANLRTPVGRHAAGISPGERVLDVGCGCGTTTIEAAARAAQDTTEALLLGRDLGGIAVA